MIARLLFKCKFGGLSLPIKLFGQGLALSLPYLSKGCIACKEDQIGSEAVAFFHFLQVPF